MDEYSHSPITEPRRIRVFTMAPASSEDDDIRGILTEVSLDAEPIETYWALSYTWDNQLPDQEIRCSGSKILVTRNCFAALKKMRFSKAVTRIWIDSLCINQADLVERSHQVALMGEIYKKAAKVLVWLGEWTQEMSKAALVMRYVAGPDIVDPVRLFGWSAETADEVEKLLAELRAEIEPEARTDTTVSSALGSVDSARATPESIRAGVRARAREVKNGQFSASYYRPTNKHPN